MESTVEYLWWQMCWWKFCYSYFSIMLLTIVSLFSFSSLCLNYGKHVMFIFNDTHEICRDTDDYQPKWNSYADEPLSGRRYLCRDCRCIHNYCSCKCNNTLHLGSENNYYVCSLHIPLLHVQLFLLNHTGEHLFVRIWSVLQLKIFAWDQGQQEKILQTVNIWRLINNISISG